MDRDLLRRETKLFFIKAEVFDKVYNFYLHQRTLQTDHMKKSVRDFMKNNSQFFENKPEEEYDRCRVEILDCKQLTPLHTPDISFYISETKY